MAKRKGEIDFRWSAESFNRGVDFFKVFVVLEKYLLLFVFALSIGNVRLVIFGQVEFLF